MFNGRHFDKSVILLCVRWYLNQFNTGKPDPGGGFGL